MDILKRLFQVSQWLAFLPFLMGMLSWIMILINKGFVRDDIVLVLAMLILPYPSIILTRWILFKEWIFLPWQKGTTKED
jgi:hypothetical protein